MQIQTSEEMTKAIMLWESNYKPANLAATDRNAQIIFQYLVDHDLPVSPAALSSAVQACRMRLDWLQMNQPTRGSLADRLASVGVQAQTGRVNHAHPDDKEEIGIRRGLNMLNSLVDKGRLRQEWEEANSLKVYRSNGSIDHARTETARKEAIEKFKKAHPDYVED